MWGVVAVVVGSAWGFTYDEAIDGEITGIYGAPTSLGDLRVGTNQVRGVEIGRAHV